MAEGWKDVVAGGAMALGALGAVAQTMPDVNVQQVELANKYYNVLVQRAKEDGIKLDTRTLNIIKAKAQDAAAKKTQQSTPQQSFPTQGSERRVAKDAGQFESQGVAEGSLDDIEDTRQFRNAIALAKSQKTIRHAKHGKDTKFYADGTPVTPEETARRAAERKARKQGVAEGNK